MHSSYSVVLERKIKNVRLFLTIQPTVYLTNVTNAIEYFKMV